MVFWSNNGKGNSIDMKIVGGILEKYDEPPYILELITKSGKIKWEYSTKNDRDNDAKALRKLIADAKL